MADTVANIAKGRFVELAKLGAASDALIAIPLETAGIVSDAILADYDTVADMLAGATNEQTDMGRQTLTGVTVTLNDTDNRHEVDCDPIVWTAATGDPVSKLCIAYDDNTGTGTDANLVPLFYLDCVGTPNGEDFTYNPNAVGLATAS